MNQIAWMLVVIFGSWVLVIGTWGLARIICDYKLDRSRLKLKHQVGSVSASSEAERAVTTGRSEAQK